MFKKILVPVDGSAPSDAAVGLAIDLARDHGGEIEFCHAVDAAALAVQADPYGLSDTTMTVEMVQNQGKTVLDAAQQRANGAAVKAATKLLDGEIVQAIEDEARTFGADVIVMGSHGRSGISRLVLGSKTEGVLQHNTIPVLVAPHVAKP